MLRGKLSRLLITRHVFKLVKIAFRWDRLYDEWSAANFDALDVAGDCREGTKDVHDKLVAAREVLGENPVVSELSEKVWKMRNGYNFIFLILNYFIVR